MLRKNIGHSESYSNYISRMYKQSSYMYIDKKELIHYLFLIGNENNNRVYVL